MTRAADSFYKYTLCAILVAFALEALLELRHYRLGYRTPIFGEISASAEELQSVSTQRNYGPTTDFPFRSHIIAPRPMEKAGWRIWISSASHAVGGRITVESIFPNMLCGILKTNIGCEVINGSQVGMTIPENVALLQRYQKVYQPNVVLLYQLSTFMAQQANNIAQKNQGVTANNVSNPFIDIHPLLRVYQSLSLYVHLSDFIGNNIKLQGPLKKQLPSHTDIAFEHQVKAWINQVRGQGALPVLVTFAASHTHKNLHQMPANLRTNFVKWVSTPYLSPQGWVNSVAHFNEQLVRLARSENIPVIALSEVNGKPQYFLDFVHFNRDGHAKVASILANELSHILNSHRQTITRHGEQ